MKQRGSIMGAYIRISRRGSGSGFNRRGRGEQSRGRRENALFSAFLCENLGFQRRKTIS